MSITHTHDCHTKNKANIVNMERGERKRGEGEVRKEHLELNTHLNTSGRGGPFARLPAFILVPRTHHADCTDFISIHQTFLRKGVPSPHPLSFSHRTLPHSGLQRYVSPTSNADLLRLRHLARGFDERRQCAKGFRECEERMLRKDTKRRQHTGF